MPKSNSEPDEQRGEGDRDQVEAADHQDPEPRRDRETCEQGGEDRENELWRTQRGEQNERHHGERACGVESHVFRDGGEFVVRERHLTRQAQLDSVFLVEMQVGRRLSHQPDRVGARLKVGIVDDRLGDHDSPLVHFRRGGRASARRQQLAPVDLRLFSSERLFDPGGKLLDAADVHFHGAFAAGSGLEVVDEHARQAAQTWIFGERFENVALADHHADIFFDVGDRQEQQAVLAEIFVLVRAPYARQEGLALQRRVETFRGVVGLFGGLAVDDDDDDVEEVREGFVERRFILAPGDIWREKISGLRIDGEPFSGDIYAPRRQTESEQNHCPRPAEAKGDQLFKHSVFPAFWRKTSYERESALLGRVPLYKRAARPPRRLTPKP